MTAESERAAIVAWLRGTAKSLDRMVEREGFAPTRAGRALVAVAERIERGEHIKDTANG